MRALVLALTLISMPALAGANPSLDLGTARKDYDAGRYAETVKRLYDLLYVKKEPLPDDELVEAHKLLGTSYFFLGDKDLAHDEWAALLDIDPDYEMDPVLEDSAVLADYEGTKHALADRRRERRHQLALAEARKELTREQITITRDVEKPQTYLNWLPPGGQFRNGDMTKGMLILGGEVVFGGTSVALATYQWLHYGNPFTTRIPNSEVDTVRSLQVWQIGLGLVAVAVYSYGVIDGYAHQRTIVRATHQQQKFIPIVTDSGAGLGVSWEF